MKHENVLSNKIILDNYLVGDKLVYGLKTKDTDPPEFGKAASVLLPTHAPHTRYYFAKQKQQEIILDLAKRIYNGWTSQGIWGRKALSKINQCQRIIDYYTTNKGEWTKSFID